jgi:hypothetical protein
MTFEVIGEIARVEVIRVGKGIRESYRAGLGHPCFGVEQAG